MNPTVKHSLTVCPVCEERRNSGQNSAQWPILQAWSEQKQWPVNGAMTYLTKHAGIRVPAPKQAMGYDRIFTYTLPEEGGASLRAAGFKLDKDDAGGSAKMWHNRDGRTVDPVGNDLIGGKWRWAA